MTIAVAQSRFRGPCRNPLPSLFLSLSGPPELRRYAPAGRLFSNFICSTALSWFILGLTLGWRTVSGLLDAGLLPNLLRMVESGVTGHLSPRYSRFWGFAICARLITGRTGGPPRNTDALSPPTREPAAWSRPLSGSLRSKPIWRILADEAVPTIAAAGCPFLYPDGGDPGDVRGFKRAVRRDERRRPILGPSSGFPSAGCGRYIAFDPAVSSGRKNSPSAN